jgi:hypothetical protein
LLERVHARSWNPNRVGASVTLEWHDKRTDERGYRSKCGRYSVSSIGDGPSESWEAWKLAPGGPWFAQIAVGLRTEQAAQDVCELNSQQAAA